MGCGVVTMRGNRSLGVLMNGILTGKLEKTIKGSLTFTYDQKWLATPGARPISLSLPLIAGSLTILDEMLLQIDSVIEQVSEQLPKNFPKDISQAIFDGMRKTKQKLIK